MTPKNLFFLIVLLLTSCQEEHKTYPDKSFDLNGYYAIGIRNVDSAWGYEDYKICIDKLESLKSSDPYAIPRLKSKKSADLFQKLISDEYQSLIVQRFLSGQDQNAEIYKKLINIYIEDGDKFQGYSYEVVPILTLGLQLNQKIYFELERMSEEMGMGSNSQVTSLMNSLRIDLIQMATNYVAGLEDEMLLQSELVLTAKNIQKLYPRMLEEFPSDEVSQLKVELAYQASNHKLEEVRAILSDLMKNRH